MNYRTKFIKAVSFAAAFMLVATVSYTVSRNRYLTAHRMSETEKYLSCTGFSVTIDELRLAALKDNSETEKLLATVASRQLAASGADSEKAVGVYGLLSAYQQGGSGKNEYEAIAKLAKRLNLIKSSNAEIEDYLSIIYSCIYSPYYIAAENKSPVKSRDGGNYSDEVKLISAFTGDCIKYNFTTNADGFIIAENENRYFVIDESRQMIIFYSYDLDTAETVASQSLSETALRYAVQAVPQSVGGAGLCDAVLSYEADGVAYFDVTYPKYPECTATLALTADTGRAVLFDARKLYDRSLQ